VAYDEKSILSLTVALERCEHMLTYCWDGGFLGTSAALRMRLSASDLRRKEGKHLWYAAERAYVMFQKILRAEAGILTGEPFKGRPKGAAVAAWNKCLTDNFEVVFYRQDPGRMVDDPIADGGSSEGRGSTAGRGASDYKEDQD
jgi:hypothetical protein